MLRECTGVEIQGQEHSASRAHGPSFWIPLRSKLEFCGESGASDAQTWNKRSLPQPQPLLPPHGGCPLSECGADAEPATRGGPQARRCRQEAAQAALRGPRAGQGGAQGTAARRVIALW